MLDKPAGSGFDTVVCLTDYGLADEFVGLLHLVLHRLAPDVSVIDLTHDVPAHDVRTGAVLLWRAARWLAPAVVLGVVDPGVGTSRRPVAIEVESAGGPLVFVGPDNGLLTPAAHAAGTIRRAFALDDPDCSRTAQAMPPVQAAPPVQATLPVQRGVTFAGRDFFAPVAARVCRGADLASLGTAVNPGALQGGPLKMAQSATAECGADGLPGLTIHAEALIIDAFGNVALNVGPVELDSLSALGASLELVGPERAQVPARGPIPLRRVAAFGDLRPGEVGVVLDSAGLAALCVDRQSAASVLGLATGDHVRLRRTTG